MTLQKGVKPKPNLSETPLSEFGVSRVANSLKRSVSGTLNVCGSAAVVACYAAVLGGSATLATIKGRLVNSSTDSDRHPDILAREFEDTVIFSNIYLSDIRHEIDSMLRELETVRPHSLPETYASLVGNKLIKKYAFSSGVVGGITSAPGVLPGIGTIGTTVVSTSADLFHLVRAQVKLCYGIACAYGVDMEEEDLRAVSLALIGFSGSVEAVRWVSGKVLRRTIDKIAANYLGTGGVSKAISVVLQKAGLRSGHRVLKMLPILGIPLGASMNVASTVTVGKNAKKYFMEVFENRQKKKSL